MPLYQVGFHYLKYNNVTISSTALETAFGLENEKKKQNEKQRTKQYKTFVLNTWPVNCFQNWWNVNIVMCLGGNNFPK